ncbi:MAG TPA: VIT and VWA domain-containing protein [Thermohalobaculum sp.]|nr:VIT and VWA domain-containing protein [Thermohalobaculum sp.]
MRIIALCSLLVAAITLPQMARASLTDEGLGGHVTAEANGQQIVFPTLKTEVTGDLQGDLATVTIRQVFANPTLTPLNATYLFPLNKDAAVHAMTMEVAGEIVTAVIARREEARQTFETAKSEGRSAALLEQHRPNMFTQEIANLMPGEPVTVTLEYSQVVPRVDGAYELRVPLVVGPRYIPPAPALVMAGFDSDAPAAPMDDETPAAEQPAALGEWSFPPVPDYPPVAGLTIPPLVDAERVSLNLTLKSGMPIGSVSSPTHGLDTSGDETARAIALAGGKTLDNRDFVLRYSLAGDRPRAGLLTHTGPEGGTFSILIEPPEVPREGEIAAREMVFVLDTSGSMSGAPIEASKTFMRHALKTLRPADSFRIIHFANSASEFSTGTIPATPLNLARGTAYVNGLQASGGTEFLSGLRAAYARPTPPNLLRIVVFLSDGYVGNETEILRLVAAEVGKGRLYAFAVGTSVNRYLMTEMARLGRGLSRIIDPAVQGQEDAIAFASRLSTPVLTDIDIDWGDLDPAQTTPAFIPDLFDGDSIRVQGRFPEGAHAITVKGRVNGRPVSMPLEIAAGAEPSPGGEAIPLIWARSRIADHMREMTVPDNLRLSGLSDRALQEKVTKLGLEYSLVTQWTSFVAVSQRIANPEPAMAIDADVPLPMVEGVTALAYPNTARPSLVPSSIMPTKAQAPGAGNGTLVAFAGGGTPEPAQLLGLIALLLTLGGAILRQSRRAHAP